MFKCPSLLFVCIAYHIWDEQPAISHICYSHGKWPGGEICLAELKYRERDYLVWAITGLCLSCHRYYLVLAVTGITMCELSQVLLGVSCHSYNLVWAITGITWNKSKGTFKNQGKIFLHINLNCKNVNYCKLGTELKESFIDCHWL